MTLAIFCFLFAIVMIVQINHTKEDNPNGLSIAVFQKIIGFIDFVLCRFEVISFVSFSINPEKSNPKKIEKIVWSRLCIVSVISLVYELLLHFFDVSSFVFHMRFVLCAYLMLLQISMVNSLLKPLFGVKRIGNTLELDKPLSQSKNVKIPTPKRSLLLAFVNLFEIILTWGIIYRSIMPCTIDNADKANYFSIVTITTLGYGEINGGNQTLVQVAISMNMIIFVLFSICHITTILGTLTNKADD